MDIKHVLKAHAYRNIPLDFDEAYALGRYALEGCAGNELAQVQSIAALCALHNRATYEWEKRAGEVGENGHAFPANASGQIAGICAAIFELDISRSSYGFLRPRVAMAMDNCGMGGDLVVTANVSTIAAFIAAAAGIVMCKHGSPANADKGRHGSSDFISMCGIDEYADKATVERCVEQLSFGYTEALDTRYKSIHLQTHSVAQLPHMNDIIGPITNPMDPALLTRRVLGVNHLIPLTVVARAYLLLNERKLTQLEHGLFIRGYVGLQKREDCGVDEVSVCVAGTQVVELQEGVLKEFHLLPEDFGITPVPPEAVSPPAGMSKGEFSLKILKGEITGPVLKMILANAALLFYLAGHSRNLAECYQFAEEVQRSGKAYQRMLEVQKMAGKKQEVTR